MTILNRNDQSGRSMIEMLGVLAIIGVLSVGGISGYSKAMAKYKLTKAQDQITMLLMNIRTAYATSPSYSDLTSIKAAEYNLAPNEMVTKNTNGSYTGLNGTFGGAVTVEACTADKCGENHGNTYFYITFASLGKEACRSLASSDCGADGLVSMKVGDTSYGVSDLPVNLGAADTACGDGPTDVTWIYY